MCDVVANFLHFLQGEKRDNSDIGGSVKINH